MRTFFEFAFDPSIDEFPRTYRFHSRMESVEKTSKFHSQGVARLQTFFLDIMDGTVNVDELTVYCRRIL